MGIEALQVRYCKCLFRDWNRYLKLFKMKFCIFENIILIGLTVKELEDLIEKQKKLLKKLRDECKTLNEQLQILAVKYK